MAVTILSCGNAKVKEYKLEVVAEYPHDTDSYTQGLFFDEGQMYESTGMRGKSTFRKVDMATGKPLRRLEFDKSYFVEGSVVWKDNLYILTWESKVAFVYDAETLEYKSSWKYPREGWGITTDGKMYSSSKVARDRDRLREQVLTGLGWKLYHLWSTDWYRNRDLGRKKLLEFVEKSIRETREEEKRKIYVITELGNEVLSTELKRIERLYRITQEEI